MLIAGLLGTGPAMAATIDWGAHDASESGARQVTGIGVFHDQYLFTLSQAVTLATVAVANNNGAILNIAGGSYGVYLSNGDANYTNDTLLGNWTYSGTTGSVQNLIQLGAGSYYLDVTGSTTGIAGGVYTIASTLQPAVVPIPASLALFAGGIGLLGFLRRKKS